MQLKSKEMETNNNPTQYRTIIYFQLPYVTTAMSYEHNKSSLQLLSKCPIIAVDDSLNDTI